MTLLMVLMLSFGSPTLLVTTIKVDQSDKYERRFVDNETFPHEFYASFVTVYKVNNQVVKTDEFWRASLYGKTLQVKAMLKNGFWFATRLNLLDDDR